MRGIEESRSMRYRLRTLLLLLAIGPPMLAVAWTTWQRWRESRDLEEWNFAPTEYHPLIIWGDELTGRTN
jgi:hypothetical protein